MKRLSVNIWNSCRYLVLAITTLCLQQAVNAQVDSSLFITPAKDTVKQGLTMDAVFNRPFLKTGKSPVSIGGYSISN